tara:strand:- start:77 stop:619 length:543 start_codon:yes stop_codon:yes gene_type:complete
MTEWQKSFSRDIIKRQVPYRKFFWQIAPIVPSGVLLYISVKYDIGFLGFLAVLIWLISQIVWKAGSLHSSFKAIKTRFSIIKDEKPHLSVTQAIEETLLIRKTRLKRNPDNYVNIILERLHDHLDFFEKDGIRIFDYEDLFVYVVTLNTFELENNINDKRWDSFKQKQLDDIKECLLTKD